MLYCIGDLMDQYVYVLVAISHGGRMKTQAKDRASRRV